MGKIKAPTCSNAETSEMVHSCDITAGCCYTIFGPMLSPLRGYLRASEPSMQGTSSLFNLLYQTEKKISEIAAALKRTFLKGKKGV